MNSKKILIVAGIVSVVIGIAVIKGLSGSNHEKTVEVSPLTDHIIEASILASGTLTHEEEVDLTSEEIGKVKAIYV